MAKSKRGRRWGPIAAAALAVLMISTTVLVVGSGDSPSDASPRYDVDAAANNWPLNSRGEPRTAAIDPADQRHTGLSEAAAEPRGLGVTSLASGMRGRKPRRDVRPDEVLPSDSAKNGGCIGAYGKPGQCLPVVPPAHAGHHSGTYMWTCSEVRQVFAQGIPLRKASVDPQQLDTNKDNVACGPGDNA